MYRSISEKNLWALRNLLEKKFKKIMTELPGSGDRVDGTKYFSFDFTNAEPEYEITIRVTADEFDATVMEREIHILRSQVKKQNEEIAKLKEATEATDLEEIRETIIEHGDKVFTHQILLSMYGNTHRLIECCDPPQKVGEWYPMEDDAKLGDYTCTYQGKFTDWS